MGRSDRHAGNRALLGAANLLRAVAVSAAALGVWH